MKKIAIVNGPNLNLLGKREVDIYGNIPFHEYFETLSTKYPSIDLYYYQSNHEGALIDYLQEIGFSYDGIVLNAGGYSHTSIALADCVTVVTTPVVEVHISNIKNREAFRFHSYLEAVSAHSIFGKGLFGYDLALDFILGIKR